MFMVFIVWIDVDMSYLGVHCTEHTDPIKTENEQPVSNDPQLSGQPYKQDDL